MANIGTLNPLLRKARDEGWDKWVRSAKDESAVLAGCRFELPRAERTERFFAKFLRHFKGEWAGKPFLLMPFQRDDIIYPIFGWIRGEDPNGPRLYRRAYIEMPKKQGKSPLAAAVGIYMEAGDGEAGAEVYSAATVKEQASIVHDIAITMVQKSPALSKWLTVNRTTKTIFMEATSSKYRALSGDADSAEGLNIHCLISDEMHVWHNRAFKDALRHGFSARRQPLDFMITTAGIYDEESIGYQEHDYASRVIAEEVEDAQYFAYIRSIPDDVDALNPEVYCDPKMHALANPAYGIIIKPEDIMHEALIAKQRPRELGNFLRYKLSVWAEIADSAFDMTHWNACSDPVDEDALVGRPCLMGLDLSAKQDLTACILLFPPNDTDALWRVLCRFWVPRTVAEERDRSHNIGYTVWARQGYITLTDGGVVDHRAILRAVEADVDKFHPKELCADDWQLDYLVEDLKAIDPKMTIIPVAQKLRPLTEPTKRLLDLVTEHRFAHGGNPVLRWCAQNCVPVEDNSGNIRLKKRTKALKIDGIDATITALARAIVAPPAPGPNKYETEELTVA